MVDVEREPGGEVRQDGVRQDPTTRQAQARRNDVQQDEAWADEAWADEAWERHAVWVFQVLDANTKGRVSLGELDAALAPHAAALPEAALAKAGEVGVVYGDDVELDLGGFVAVMRAARKVDADIVAFLYNVSRAALEPWDEQPWFHQNHPHLPPRPLRHGGTVSDETRRDVERRKRTWTAIASSLLAGGCAGAMAKSAVAPLDRTKILFQVNHPRFAGSPGVLATLKQIVRLEGLRGLYKGNGAQMVRIFPYAAVQFMSYEQYKRILLGGDDSPLTGSTPPLVKLAAGALAGMSSVVATYPLDLVRARLASQVEVHAYTSIRECLFKTAQSEGIRGLYKGLSPTLVGIVPYAGLSFFTFDTLKEKARELLPAGQPLPVVASLACGAIAGLVSQTVTYPIDSLRRRAQLMGSPVFASQSEAFSSRTKHMSATMLLSHLIKKEGPLSLFRGLSINYMRVVPSVAISFTTFEYLKARLPTDAR
ncbi:graves disease carrier protein [Thecamonas trahens ATCC 50062]|uniref:Graves disease carrier protein n=1 Tax=Thecamonas trahens ATCC 50062 TaxID=461836 RepID=A0A0L0D6L1_THETB|nr:graves disease carrier protein [Thecamonas trahens ATCC 50062]KNC48017.1 graves disease carrier protein [Thecamonas trahens ATCC 50062]|eukprot:XP_013759032.1 graves disease carrier protein [Thecamonas trahens ATCC 50062]